ncbi:Nucleotide-binding universal stress protein, UspA family [Halovenus aranensis]|jgi:nucleotide-binding universal stress UspA family protein|uniref:Nucleotide-binding universal stress protein, UspA family n=1 Tax=Halovenus aranensis TaxID=890420 RepID=A0A1G8RNQ2_9EURY|nr:universal stress protein [Halovenus aranensis]SDJ18611.1 Nucleotide-binding universal stress protein, UspA family [Halovenus aranensis]
MFDTVVIATDGSDSAKRGIRTALDVASTFDATVHAVYVVDAAEIASSPEEVRDQLKDAIESTGTDALDTVREEAETHGEPEVVTAFREGSPKTEIIEYAKEVEADVIAMGTRGRHGEHSFLLGSVAESVVRQAPMPVLTVRQLEN